MDFSAVFAHSDLLIHGMVLTVVLSGGAMLCGTALAVLLALLRQATPRFFVPAVTFYVAVIRNTPLLVQLLFVYFGLPLLGLRLSAVAASLLTLSVNLGAYAVEIIRAGIESIGSGQMEAALALALPYRRVLRLVILPQALARVWPALSAQYVHTLLGSSLCSVVSVVELAGAAALIDEVTFRSMETYLIVSAIYLAFAWSLRMALAAAGAHLFRARRMASA